LFLRGESAPETPRAGPTGANIRVDSLWIIPFLRGYPLLEAPPPGPIGVNIRVDSLWILPFLRGYPLPEAPPPGPLPLAGEGEPEAEVRGFWLEMHQRPSLKRVVSSGPVPWCIDTMRAVFDRAIRRNSRRYPMVEQRLVA